MIHFSADERIALFIDGPNLYASAKSLGFDIDYKDLLKTFRKQGRLIRAYYYTTRGRSGIFSDPAADRLAGLQRLRW